MTFLNSTTLNRTPECKRHLQTTLNDGDDAQLIARELAEFAFISYEDVEVMTLVIQVNISRYTSARFFKLHQVIVCNRSYKP